ncbi:Uncharacterized protein FKW44_019741 [Caligus rogercresseyi]|uniref:Uncharacterized protein n=1 Tax=Caligus rogercresseyi TaxID=217165 RepID=A0A7T8GW89_CALRO|nr:Uncharacterized protein FKW44_019741 [Caligus rogercresseyi]
MNSGRELGSSNDRDLIWVTGNPSVILTVDFRINTEDFLVREESDSSGTSVFQCRDQQLTSLQPLLLHGIRKHLTDSQDVAVAPQVLMNGMENSFPVHI